MTDNQDSKIISGAQAKEALRREAYTPPTDRPLTAGDVPLLRRGDILDHHGDTVTVDRINDLIQYSGHGFWGNDAPEKFTFVSRPATSAASEGEQPWEPAAEAMCAEVIKQSEVTCRKATDELYEGLLYSVQDYLRENVMLNLSGELERAHGYERDARTALVEIAKAAGVDFVDSRDGVERQKERILAALASPPVSERERELSVRTGNLWWNSEDWETTFDSIEDAYDAATQGSMRGIAALGRATQHDTVFAVRIDIDTTGDGDADDYEIRLFPTREEALTAQPAGEGK